MGNGAALQNGQSGGTAKKLAIEREQFEQIEMLCRNDHFKQHFQEYTLYFQRAIKNDALDVIELLLAAGNAKKLQPLHIACKLGKLEAAELLLSAGFSLYLKDERGRVALHLCSLKNTQGAALCATLLALQGGKRLINTTDNLGYTVLHLAAQHDNIIVIQALINIRGINVRCKDNRGLTALDIAVENDAHKAAELLEKFARASKARQSNGGLSDTLLETAPSEPSEVDMERIMQVWERFFENAFNMNGIDIEEAAQSNDTLPRAEPYCDDFQRKHLMNIPLEEAEYGYPPTPHKSAKSMGRKKVKDVDASPFSERKQDRHYTEPYRRDEHRRVDDTYKEYFDRIEKSKAAYTSYDEAATVDILAEEYEKPYSSLDNDAANEVIAWLDWVVCYDYSFGDSPEGYYVINKYTKEWKWLSQHIEDFLRSTLIPTTSWDDYDFNMNLPYPTTLFDLICRGWLTYYDISTNTSDWLNVPTCTTERSLPLGMGEDHDTLTAFHLRRHGTTITGQALEEQDPSDERSLYWYEADPICSISWIVVVSHPPQLPPGSARSCDEMKESKQFSSVHDTKETQAAIEGRHGEVGDDPWPSSKTDRNPSVSNESHAADDKEVYETKADADEYISSGKDASNAEVSYYYLHRITQESSWEPPSGWDELLGSWGGWTLCCDEEYPDQPYWHDFDTGDSIWAES